MSEATLDSRLRESILNSESKGYHRPMRFPPKPHYSKLSATIPRFLHHPSSSSPLSASTSSGEESEKGEGKRSMARGLDEGGFPSLSGRTEGKRMRRSSGAQERSLHPRTRMRWSTEVYGGRQRRREKARGWDEGGFPSLSLREESRRQG